MKKVALVVLLGLFAIVALSWRGLHERYLDHEHRSQRERIAALLRARQDRPPAGADANGWRAVLSSLITAIANDPICYRAKTPTERVKALADDLERTNGANLDSLVGLMRLSTRLVNLCPIEEPNSALGNLFEEQAIGGLPTPPEELRKKPWAERKKEAEAPVKP